MCLACYDHLSKTHKTHHSAKSSSCVGGNISGVGAAQNCQDTPNSTAGGGNKLNNDSSGDDDSDEEAGPEQHDEPKFYGDTANITIEESLNSLNNATMTVNNNTSQPAIINSNSN